MDQEAAVPPVHLAKPRVRAPHEEQRRRLPLFQPRIANPSLKSPLRVEQLICQVPVVDHDRASIGQSQGVGRASKVPRAVAASAEANHELAARIDHDHRQITAGPVPDVQVALLVESDRRDPRQEFPIASPVADAVDFGEFGVEDTVLQGQFDDFLGGEWERG